MTREERNNTTKNCLNCKHQDFICEVKGCKDYKKWEQADEEKSFKMRDATPEEQEAIDKYIKSISKPTGINIFDFYDDEDKSCDNCKHHLKFMCKNWRTCHDYSDWELEELDFVQPHKTIPCKIKVADGEYISKDTAIDDITTGLCEEIACSECPFDKPDIICKVQKWLRQLPSVNIPPEHDGCKDCKYETYPEYYYPCCECKQNYTDEWEKKPHWNHGVCDNCGYDWGKDAPIASVPNFCPNCGSPMEIER